LSISFSQDASLVRYTPPIKNFSLLIAFCVCCSAASAQNFERYRPITPQAPAVRSPNLSTPQQAVSGSDRQLLESLDAVIVLDNADAVQPQNANEDAAGLIHQIHDRDSLVHSAAFSHIIHRYLGQPVSLRSLNQMSFDIIQMYRRHKRPIVDVLIPEQKITGGTVQIVVIESRIGRVAVQDGCYTDACDLKKWVQCTRPGGRIYEPWIEDDLFWLNQNPFRRVTVDLRPGAVDGTTDVIFETRDVRPIRGYIGYDDTGVQSLNRERLLAGVILGDPFGRDGILSYQYTGDGALHRLHAHAVSYNLPIDRCRSFQAYGSWAGVTPALGGGLTQEGESWQAGLAMVRHLYKSRWGSTNLSAGFDFKSTNNNLEFGGTNVSASEADLVQLRIGIDSFERRCCDEYTRARGDVYVGPGDGFTSNHNRASFNTIRPGTSPDYVYGRVSFEDATNIDADNRWQLVSRAVGQASSERLLFSETLGFGGFDSVRGYDQRTLSGDHGWLASFELGPRPRNLCIRDRQARLRYYSFIDMGDSYIADPLPGENANQFLWSSGVGMQFSVGQDLSLRMDYGFGFEDVAGLPNDRLHLGLIWQIGPRP
jgi:hemolysin activation/secretion protein